MFGLVKKANLNVNLSQLFYFGELTLGAGHVFKSSTPLMFEISTTLMAEVGKHFVIGATNQYNKTFYELFLRVQEGYSLFKIK